MKKKLLSPRKEIENFPKYVPGTSIEEIKRKYKLEKVDKLASNENLWGFSEKAGQAIIDEIKDINYYPQSDPEALAEALVVMYKINKDCLIFGNGTDELIEIIARAFLSPQDNIVVSRNSFIRYKMAGLLMGARVIEAPQKNYTVDPAALAAAVNKNTKIVYIDNPCNPTGTYMKFAEIKKMLAKIEKSPYSPLIVFDEAYFEYVRDPEYKSGAGLIGRGVPVAVLRTFSKIYGLAGLRIGYAVSTPEIIGYLQKIRPPFNTNRIAQAAAEAALKDRKFIASVAVKTETEKRYLYNEFDKLELEYVPSGANFILVKLGKKNGENLCNYLLRKGIVLRPLYGYSLEDYVRITIGKREQNMRLLKNLKIFMGRTEAAAK